MEHEQSSTVVLAGDHAIVREGIASLCANSGFKILGQCSDGAAAIEIILLSKPELAILDLHPPGMSVDLIRKLRGASSTTKLIILSISRDESFVAHALRAGADGYLLKDDPSSDLLEAIRYIRDGGVYLSPLLWARFAHSETPPTVAAENPLSILTPREVAVFSYLVDGLRAREIAQLLGISHKTVDTYRAGLMRKLRVYDLVGLVKFAIMHSLTTTSNRK